VKEKHHHHDTDTTPAQDAQQLLRDSKTLAERMASNRSLDPLDRAIRDFASHLKENTEIRAYFKRLRAFMLKAVEDPEYFATQQHRDELRSLLDEGSALMDKNRENTALKAISKELREFRRALNNDPVTRKLKANLQRVANDFFIDENGKALPNVDNINQFRKIIVPLMSDQFNNLPLPAVEQSDDKMAYGVEGVILRGKKLLPERIDLDVKASVHLAKDVPTSTTMTVSIQDIGVEVEQASFWYERYTFPKVTDQGNIALVIEGMSVLMEIMNAPLDSRHVFKLSKAECRIHSVSYSITNAKHETAYKILQPMLTSVLKNQIQKAVEDKLGSFLLMLDHQLIKRREQLKQSRDEANVVHQNAQQRVQNKIENEARQPGSHPTTVDKIPEHDYHHGEKSPRDKTRVVETGHTGDHHHGEKSPRDKTRVVETVKTGDHHHGTDADLPKIKTADTTGEHGHHHGEKSPRDKTTVVETVKTGDHHHGTDSDLPKIKTEDTTITTTKAHSGEPKVTQVTQKY
jgi:DNA-directed RNA polymerase subunit H (RpoH/RPB5)